MGKIDEPIVEHFLRSETRERLDMIQNPATAGSLKSWMGDDAFEEYVGLSRKVDVEHLAGPAVPNLIFVPGVMGSLLTSRTLGGVWWIDARSRKHLNNLRLGPDGLSDENPTHDVASFAVDMTYEGFFAAVLDRDDFEHVAFHYDWRKPLSASTERLRDSILRICAANGKEEVHLVAHSMGGLLVRATLKQYPVLWQHVGKIVFLGTPHYGSPAIAGYLKNHLWGFNLLAMLGHYLDRETFRSMWGVLSLLPAPTGVYPGTRVGEVTPHSEIDYPHPCVNFDLYDASSWELGIDGDKEARLQTILDAAASFHRELFTWHIKLDQGLRDKMTVIAGVGFKTLFRLNHKRAAGFLWDTTDKVFSRDPGDPNRDGDGRVPVASAALEWVDETRYGKVEHGRMPTVPAVYEDTFRFLSGESMQLPSTPSGALHGHLSDDLMESETPALVDAYVKPEALSPDDPGYLNLDEVDATTMKAIERALEEERLPAFSRVRLL